MSYRSKSGSRRGRDASRIKRRKNEAIRRRNRIRIVAFCAVVLLLVIGTTTAISKLFKLGKAPEIAAAPVRNNIGGDVSIVTDKSEGKGLEQKTDNTDITQMLNGSKSQVQNKPKVADGDKLGFTDKMQKFYKAAKQTEVLRSTNDKSDVLTEVPLGAYLETYGTDGTWIKVKYYNQTGYVAKEDLKPIEEENMFKVIDGILIVNRKYGLPADFNPGVSSDAMQSYEMMKEDMRRNGLDIKIVSDFRTYQDQVEVYESSVKGYGKQAADEMTALPGHSEHQSGYAFDLFTNDDTVTIDDSFDDTREAEWLADNSYKYGFVLRYPRGKDSKTGYKFESWHFRYVGPETAKKLYDSGLTIEEYYNLND